MNGWIWALLAFVAAFAIGDGAYVHYFRPAKWPDLQGEVLTGLHAGRCGVVTSHWPFDLLVTINVAANEDEKSAMVEKAIARNCGWKRAAEAKYSGEDAEANFANARTWIRDWRWNVKLSKKQNGWNLDG